MKRIRAPLWNSQIPFGEALKKNYPQVIMVGLAFLLMVLVSYYFVGMILRGRLQTNAEAVISTTEADMRTTFVESDITLNTAVPIVEEIIASGGSNEEILEYLKKLTYWMRHDGSAPSGFYGTYGLLRDEFIDGIGLNPGPDFVPQTRPWYQLGIRTHEGTAYTTPYIDKRTGNNVITAVRSLTDAEGALVGVIALDMNVEWLGNYVNAVALSRGSYAMIFSPNLITMVHPDKEKIGLQMQELGGPYQEFSDRIRRNESITAARFTDTNGVFSIAYFRRIFNGWAVALVIPFRVYYRDLYLSAGVISALGLTLMLILSYILLVIGAGKMKADEENRQKSTFLATMSHEIRTPLNSIIGVSEIELLESAIPPRYRDAFSRILASGNALLDLINDILDLSKIESGKLELIPEKYDTATLIYNTAQLNMTRAGTKPVVFSLEVDPKVPAFLVGDSLRIKQILNNLLSNAFKYTENGKVVLRIAAPVEGMAPNLAERRSSQKPGGSDPRMVSLSIEVEDTGQGISADDQKRLFGEYERFNLDKNSGIQGTGLGLSITRRLAILMGGSIVVRSERGRGSVFSLTLPQEKAGDEALGEETAQRLASFTYQVKEETAEIARTPMPYGRVLIVDDVDINIYVATGLLAPYELNIDTAMSGAETLELAASHEPWDVIFLDQMMPEMDGVETLEKLRERGYKGPVVALTADAVFGRAEFLKQKGFAEFISKPIDIGQMDAILKKFVYDPAKETRAPH